MRDLTLSYELWVLTYDSDIEGSIIPMVRETQASDPTHIFHWSLDHIFLKKTQLYPSPEIWVSKRLKEANGRQRFEIQKRAYESLCDF